jgi:hypothetical protein
MLKCLIICVSNLSNISILALDTLELSKKDVTVVLCEIVLQDQ